jgi:hypothetical protein
MNGWLWDEVNKYSSIDIPSEFSVQITNLRQKMAFNEILKETFEDIKSDGDCDSNNEIFTHLDERLPESVTLFPELERLFSESNQETSGSIPTMSDFTSEFIGSEKPALAIGDTEKTVVRKGVIIPQSARELTLRMQASPKLGTGRISSARIMGSDLSVINGDIQPKVMSPGKIGEVFWIRGSEKYK